ncbi:hypothetical protein [Parvicella tangerina]|uniref:Uncharacterized protein n=1 Tax=Parvicella tangerina TaxID=2829795 RepID=A0A916JLF8_9FLAO|nr:hypothetical protein [Parvicella tangerina]CAG5079296.1 hypothetical protein CRYO30217_00909 [Parvicella tangerina]
MNNTSSKPIDMQNVEDILNNTKDQIGRVEAPDHILTRAKQQYENLTEMATPGFLWSTAMLSVVLIVFNIYVIGQQTQTTQEANEIEAIGSNLYSSPQLYSHE